MPIIIGSYLNASACSFMWGKSVQSTLLYNRKTLTNGSQKYCVLADTFDFFFCLFLASDLRLFWDDSI